MFSRRSNHSVVYIALDINFLLDLYFIRAKYDKSLLVSDSICYCYYCVCYLLHC